MSDKKKEIGIVGFGNFGKFFSKHLRVYFDITVYDIHDVKFEVAEMGLKLGTLEETVSKETVLLIVPVQYLENLLLQIAPFIRPTTLIMDMSSVKVKPLNLMIKYLPPDTQIIGTHPLFGPQSGRNGIEGLNFVVCPVRSNQTDEWIHFLKEKLKLNVLLQTADEHDHQMAYVQALTHFIGRAVNNMGIPDMEQKTPAYQYLLNIKRNLGGDSIDLFLTIENENPYARSIREEFIQELNKLDTMLN